MKAQSSLGYSGPIRRIAGKGAPRFGLARVLSKLGVSSRSQAVQWILAGKVRVNGVAIRDPEFPVQPRTPLQIDGVAIAAAPKVYLALNKPRGLVATARDERGRPTIFTCLSDAQLPHLGAVGRLDQASEGLLLLTNDTAWSADLTDPARHVDKIYHVQIDCVAEAVLCPALERGKAVEGEHLAVKRARILRQGARNSWLELVLDEGRNRHLRRLLSALGIEVLRLVRVAIGGLELGELPKGRWRHLTPTEVSALSHPKREGSLAANGLPRSDKNNFWGNQRIQ